MKYNTLNTDTSVFLFIDIQEKLIKAQLEPEKIIKNTSILAKTANILEVPVIISEQYPKGLGSTLPSIMDNLPTHREYFEKSTFSCAQNEKFKEILKKTNKKQIIICGMETHICVHQTVTDLIDSGYEVHIVKDAISSRKQAEYDLGIERMCLCGAIPTSTEMVLFELLKASTHEKFRDIQALIK